MDGKRQKNCNDRLNDKAQVPLTDNSVSAYVEVLAEKNPFEDKLLEGRLKQLDVDRKTKEDSLFWTQRHFFIEKAFDNDHELRFVKLIHRINTRSEKTVKEKTTNQDDAGTTMTKKTQKASIVEKIFPLTDEYKSEITSKYKLREKREEPSRITKKELSSEGRIKKDQMFEEMCINECSEKNTLSGQIKPQETDEEETQKLPAIINKNKPRPQQYPQMFKPQTPLIKQPSSAELNLFKKHVTKRVLGRNCKDKTMVKLTKSLPFHLLLKTNESLTDLSMVLGYKERRKRLLLKEKKKAEIPPISDHRFKNLFASLQHTGRKQQKYYFLDE